MITPHADLLDTSITTGITSDTLPGEYGTTGSGPAKEYHIGADGTMVEKPFNGENTLNEPVIETIVRPRP